MTSKNRISIDEAMLRRYLTWQHRWVGLLMTAVLVVVGLTGSILAFRVKIDRLLNPEMHVANPPKKAPLDLATLAERAEAAYPHLGVGYFSIEEDNAVLMVGAKVDPATGKPYNLGFDQLILDPWTGKVLGETREYDWSKLVQWRRKLLPFVYGLHTSLAMDNFGYRIVSIVALAWTLDCFVGFYLTLPRGFANFRKRWAQAWQIKLRANFTRINFDFHRAGGLWVWPLLFVFGWSSVMLELRNEVYQPVMKTLFDYVTDEQSIAQNSVPKPLDSPKITWREAQAAGERAMAEQARLHHFTVERAYGMAYVSVYGAYTYCVRSSLDFRGHGWDTSVLIDGNTGQFRSVDLPRGQHLGNTISTLLWGIHYGDLRDFLPFRILIFAFGFFLSLLSITGVVIWWKKLKTRNLAASRKGAATAKELSSAISDLRSANP